MTTIACCACRALLEIKPSLRRLYHLGVCPIPCTICRALNVWSEAEQRNRLSGPVIAFGLHDEKSGRRYPNPALYRLRRSPAKDA